MNNSQREIQRKKRVIEYAEEIGNVRLDLSHHSIGDEDSYGVRNRTIYAPLLLI